MLMLLLLLLLLLFLFPELEPFPLPLFRNKSMPDLKVEDCVDAARDVPFDTSISDILFL